MKIISCPSSPLKKPVWEPIAKDKVIKGHPKQAYEVLYTSASEEFFTGIWQGTPGKWRVHYTEDEFCTLIEGSIRLTPPKGKSQTFKAPCSFMIPSGYKGTWESLTKVRKFFVIYDKKQ